MTNKNFSIIEGKKHKIYFNLSNVEEESDFQIFGFFKKIGCCNSVFELEQIDNELYIPELENGIFNYQIFIKQVSTNKDFLALEGKLEVKNSLMAENNSSLGGTELEITFDSNTTEIHCEIGQGLRGEKGEKGDKGEKGEDGNEVTVEQTFSATSENAQSGKAVQNAIYANNLNATGANTILGLRANAHNHNYCTCVGHAAVSNATFGTAVGYGAVGHDCSVSVGIFSQCLNSAGFSIGYTGTNKDLGVGLFSVTDTRTANINTLLYLIGANTPLAKKYEDGAACMGYVVKDTSGNILECGTRKLSEIFTNNTTFAPATLDLDAPTPKVFLPTGITDPIEIPEEITEER